MEKVIVSASGKKAVTIGSEHGGFFACFVQEDEGCDIRKGFGQVLEVKHFATEKYAAQFAESRLSAQRYSTA
jgi:hypothetical protein